MGPDRMSTTLSMNIFHYNQKGINVILISIQQPNFGGNGSSLPYILHLACLAFRQEQKLSHPSVLDFFFGTYKTCECTALRLFQNLSNLISNHLHQLHYIPILAASRKFCVIPEILIPAKKKKFSSILKPIGTLGIFIVFKKAFNTSNHNRLLGKISNYGIRVLPPERFKDYF